MYTHTQIIHLHLEVAAVLVFVFNSVFLQIIKSMVQKCIVVSLLRQMCLEVSGNGSIINIYMKNRAVKIVKTIEP